MNIEIKKAVEKKQISVDDQDSFDYYGNIIWFFPVCALASLIIIVSEKIRDVFLFIGWISVSIIRGLLGIVEEEEDN